MFVGGVDAVEGPGLVLGLEGADYRMWIGHGTYACERKRTPRMFRVLATRAMLGCKALVSATCYATF